MNVLDVGLLRFPRMVGGVGIAAWLVLSGCNPEPMPPGPVTPGPFCGGIAGIACPGAGECVDDLADDCDPDLGGADCGGVCECSVMEDCPLGEVFDVSPKVCACTPAVTTCAAVTCVVGSFCVEYDDGTAGCVSRDPCANFECPDGTHCTAPADKPECVPDDSEVGEPCGSVLCGEGTVCCNASCSICTPPDGACIQIACEPEL